MAAGRHAESAGRWRSVIVLLGGLTVVTVAGVALERSATLRSGPQAPRTTSAPAPDPGPPSREPAAPTSSTPSDDPEAHVQRDPKGFSLAASGPVAVPRPAGERQSWTRAPSRTVRQRSARPSATASVPGTAMFRSVPARAPVTEADLPARVSTQTPLPGPTATATPTASPTPTAASPTAASPTATSTPTAPPAPSPLPSPSSSPTPSPSASPTPPPRGSPSPEGTGCGTSGLKMMQPLMSASPAASRSVALPARACALGADFASQLGSAGRHG